MFHHIILRSKSVSKQAHIHTTHPINRITPTSNLYTNTVLDSSVILSVCDSVRSL